jgi:hypothetical protein
MSDRLFRRNLVPTFVDITVSCGQRGGSPRAVNHRFQDRDAIYTSIFLLGPRQCVEAVDGINMLFANFTDLKLVPADSGFVTSLAY